MYLDKEKLNSFLLDLALLPQTDFDFCSEEALEKGVDLSQILIQKGYLDEDELREIQAKVADVSFIDLKNSDIKEDILFSIPEPISRQYNVIAFERDEKYLKVAVLDLAVLDEIDFFKKQVTLKVIPYLSDRESIKNNILKYQEVLKESVGDFIQKEFMSFQIISEEFLKNLKRADFLELARDKRLNKLFETFLEYALSQKANNIHIESQENKTLIRYRIGGDIYSAMFLPKNAALILDLKIRMYLGLDKQENKKDFSLFLNEKEVNFKVNKTKVLWGERIVLSISQPGEAGFSLEALGFYGRNLDILYKALDKKEKDILVVGEKGSGKSTTFYTFLDFLNNQNVVIGSIEESIGFYMNGINQVVVNPEINFGIKEAISKFNKQDLDILAIDAIESARDLEIIFDKAWLERLNITILETAEYSTLEIFYKLQKLGISTTKIVVNLGVIISQKMLKALSQDSKKECYLSVDEIKALGKKVNLEKVMSTLVEEGFLVEKKAWSEVLFYKGEKKSNSADDRVEEEIMVAEVLKISPTLKEMFLKGSTKKEVKEQLNREAFLTMQEDMLIKAVQGFISVEELLKF